MAARPWLRYPAREIRPPACPRGRPFATRELAVASIPAGLPIDPAPVLCPLCEGGWHLQYDTPPAIRHQPEGEAT